jgi:hypothetical protein
LPKICQFIACYKSYVPATCRPIFASQEMAVVTDT